MRQENFNGGILRERRREMGLSTYDVFRKIRVPVGYIEAIEHSRVHALPPPCYTIGFIKSYCQFLGVESDGIIQSYRACVEMPPREFLKQDRFPSLRIPMLKTSTTLVAWITVWAILGLGWLAYHVILQPHANVKDGQVEAGVRIERSSDGMVLPEPPVEPRSLRK